MMAFEVSDLAAAKDESGALPADGREAACW